MTKKSAAGMSRPNEPKGDCCALGSAAWASKANKRYSFGKRAGPCSTRGGLGLVRTGGESGEHALGVSLCFLAFYRPAEPAHQVEEEGQVVDGVEPEGEQFLGGEEVAQVGARESAAGVAGAFGVGGPRVPRVAGGLDLQAALAREEQAVSRG